MNHETLYLQEITHPRLYLSSPLPLEVTSSSNNYVVSWFETKIEGEGKTQEEAVADFTKELVKSYIRLRKEVKSNEYLSDDDDRVWTALCHFVAETKKGSSNNEGPVFG